MPVKKLKLKVIVIFLALIFVVGSCSVTFTHSNKSTTIHSLYSVIIKGGKYIEKTIIEDESE